MTLHGQSPEPKPLGKNLYWQMVSQYMASSKCFMAFPILAKMARDGDPEAHYMASQIKAIHPDLNGMEEAKLLDSISVKVNPFQAVSRSHPAYQIAIQSPTNLIARAREGRGRAALLAALYYMSSEETTEGGQKLRPRRSRYGRALAFFNLSLKDPDHHKTPYNVELIRRNVCALVDKITSVYCDTESRKTYAVFTDRSRANIDLIDESYRIINCLQKPEP